MFTEIPFETHRCPKRPRGVSIRRYLVPPELEDNPFRNPYRIREQLPELNWPRTRWVLARLEYDSEWNQDYMNDFGTIAYCPFCGKRLDSDEME